MVGRVTKLYDLWKWKWESWYKRLTIGFLSEHDAVVMLESYWCMARLLRLLPRALESINIGGCRSSFPDRTLDFLFVGLSLSPS